MYIYYNTFCVEIAVASVQENTSSNLIFDDSRNSSTIPTGIIVGSITLAPPYCLMTPSPYMDNTQQSYSTKS